MTIACLGVQRIHESRGEPAARAESHTTDSAEGNRPDGVDHSSEVHGHRAAVEAEHVRGCHDTALAFSRRQVLHLLPNLPSFSVRCSCSNCISVVLCDEILPFSAWTLLVWRHAECSTCNKNLL